MEIMAILEMLEKYKVLQIIAVIGIVGVTSQLRKYIFDKLIEKLNMMIQFLIKTGIALTISFGLTALILVYNFNIFEWLRLSIFNWIFAWIFYDTLKRFVDKGTT